MTRTSEGLRAKLCFFSAAAACLAGCKRAYNENGETLAATNAAASYKSISDPANPREWTGRLLLPRPEERRGDGGVFFEIHNAPKTKELLIGKRFWLRFKSDPEIQLWTKAVTTDVTFDNVTEGSKKAGNHHPDRLNGWKSVSPMAPTSLRVR